MVKNEGGNKAKGQARKHVIDSKQQDKKVLRTAEDELELYAQVTKNFGNGMVDVECVDGVTRLCHIRGKFRGRGKKDNFVNVGSWLLVGLRAYESGGNKSKKQNCDLLEVYNDFDKERLKLSVNIDWSAFIARDNINTNQDKKTTENTGEVSFGNEKSSDYLDLIALQSQGKSKTIAVEDDEKINVDDI
jgi:initiation factor 1A